jgi:hypothetical protein
MGATIGYTFISINGEHFDSIENLLNRLGQGEVKEISEEDLTFTGSNSFNTRNPEYIAIYSFDDFICISNIAITESLLVGNQDSITEYHKLFGYPYLISSILNHDNPSDYGYCRIENGDLKRLSFIDNYSNVIVDYGEKSKIERQWVSGILNDDGVQMYLNTQTKEEAFPVHVMNRIIDNYISTAYGIKSVYDVYEKSTDKRYFQVKGRAINAKTTKYKKSIERSKATTNKQKILITLAVTILYIVFRLLYYLFEK